MVPTRTESVKAMQKLMLNASNKFAIFYTFAVNQIFPI